MAVALYVGNLADSITATDLYEKFKTIGEIASVYVCRDHTGHSRGYGFLNFKKSADAQEAIETTTGDLLDGRPMRISWSKHDPSMKISGNGNLFMKNLHPDIDAKSLYNTFSGFGTVISTWVARDQNGKSKCYGYIQFQKEEDAIQCIKKVNGMCLDGRKVYIGKFLSKDERIKIDEAKPKLYTNVYIKNLDKNVNDKALYEMFEMYGTITSSKVMFRENGYSKCFGFVNFQKHEEAEKAVIDLNGKTNNAGKNYYAAPAQKKVERTRVLNEKFGDTKKIEHINDTNLYVKNFNGTVDDYRLYKEFCKFGYVTSTKVMREHGRSKGFGFVSFSRPEEAANALKEMNGYILDGNRLYVAFAQKKADRSKQINYRQLNTRHATNGSGDTNTETNSRGDAETNSPVQPVSLQTVWPRNQTQHTSNINPN